MLAIDPPDYFEILEEPTPKKLVHYTDAEGFEDWFDLNNDLDLATFNRVAQSNNENNISWKLEFVATEDD